MDYTKDTTFMMMIFIVPSIFGLSLIGEGVNKVMNYDSHGWLGISIGGALFIILLIAFFMFSSKLLG